MPFGSEFLDTGGTLRAYLARQELNQRQQQLDQERQNAQDTLELHHKQLDQAMKAHMDDLKYRNMVFKQAATEKYNQLYGDPLSAPSQYITGITPQTDISQQPNIGEAGGEPQAPTGVPGLGIPNPAGSLTPDIQHSLQFQARPWQMEIPGTEGMGLGPITIDPNYQARQMAVALKSGDLENQIAVRKARALLPTQLAELNAKDQDAYMRALLMFQRGIGVANINRSGGIERALINALTSGQKKGAGQFTPEEINGRAGNLLVSPKGPSTSGLDATTANHIQSQGWEPPVAGQLDVGQKGKLDNIFDATRTFQRFTDSLDTGTSGKLARLGSALKNFSASSTLLGQIFTPQQAKLYGEMKATVPEVVKDVIGYTNRLNIPEIGYGDKLTISPFETRASGTDKAIDARTIGYKHYWNSVLQGMPTTEKIFQLEHQAGGMDQLIAKFSDAPGHESTIRLSSGKVVPVIYQNKDTKQWMIVNPVTEKGVPLKSYRLNPYQAQQTGVDPTKLLESIKTLKDAGVLDAIQGMVNGSDQQ